MHLGVKLDSRNMTKLVKFEKNMPLIYFLSYFTHLPTPRSTVLLEKLAFSQLVKNFPTFYWNRMLISTFTNARHLSLTWAISIQDMPLYPTSLKSILITLSHLRLGLPIGNFPSVFPTRTLYTSLQSSYTLHAPQNLFFSILLPEIYGWRIRSLSTSLCIFSITCYLIPQGQNILQIISNY